MAKLIQISNYQKKKSPPINFTRSELNQLLTLYSHRVISGEWKDYAINSDRGMSAFSVFKDAGALPAFTIYKFYKGHKSVKFAVGSNGSLIKQDQSLRGAISFLQRRLTLVKS
ncbi:MAG: DUF2794 domain-containing protein [Alphaproteobacteria bacterium]